MAGRAGPLPEIDFDATPSGLLELYAGRAERAAGAADRRARDADRIIRWGVTLVAGVLLFLFGLVLEMRVTIGSRLDAIERAVAAPQTTATAPATAPATGDGNDSDPEPVHGADTYRR